MTNKVYGIQLVVEASLETLSVHNIDIKTLQLGYGTESMAIRKFNERVE